MEDAGPTEEPEAEEAAMLAVEPDADAKMFEGACTEACRVDGLWILGCTAAACGDAGALSEWDGVAKESSTKKLTRDKQGFMKNTSKELSGILLEFFLSAQTPCA